MNGEKRPNMELTPGVLRFPCVKAARYCHQCINEILSQWVEKEPHNILISCINNPPQRLKPPQCNNKALHLVLSLTQGALKNTKTPCTPAGTGTFWIQRDGWSAGQRLATFHRCPNSWPLRGLRAKSSRSQLNRAPSIRSPAPCLTSFLPPRGPAAP